MLCYLPYNPVFFQNPWFFSPCYSSIECLLYMSGWMVLYTSIWKWLKRGFNCVLDEWCNDMVLFQKTLSSYILQHKFYTRKWSPITNHSQLDEVAYVGYVKGCANSGNPNFFNIMKKAIRVLAWEVFQFFKMMYT